MSDLLNKKCVPCEGGTIPFDISEIHKYQKKVDGWDVKKNNKNIYFLEKNFTFKDFINSQNFINKVGEISENENHHPDLYFGVISGAYRLPNGNTLICEGDYGYWEVSRTGDVVWKFNGGGSYFWRGYVYT